MNILHSARNSSDSHGITKPSKVVQVTNVFIAEVHFDQLQT